MTGLFLLLLAGFIKANATLDKSGHMMYVEYSISEPAKDQGVVYVDILFHHKGEAYRVARHRYSEPITSIVDTFPWVSKDRWEGGNLEVVAKKADGSVERSYISESSIEIRDLGYQVPEFEHEVNGALVKANNEPDPYAWRMLGYDPGHTGYYPFHLYPPLDSLWIYDWSGAGTWTTEISGAAGQEMIFIPEAPWGWNKIEARDIETGEIIWQRYVTANAMTSALSIGDSILFVGTWIGFTPWQDTTFYALDPFTGELKWGRIFKSVQYSPIVIDSLIYVPSFGLSTIFCLNYRGDSIWASWAGFPSPAFEDGVVFHTAPDTVLNARNYLTGKFLWDFTRSGMIFALTAYEGKVIFSPSNEPLYALNTSNGQIIWTNPDYPLNRFSPAQAGFNTVFIEAGYFVNDTTIYEHLYFIDSDNGKTVWDSLFTPIHGRRGGGTLRVVITEDTLVWFAKTDAIYVLKIKDRTIQHFTPTPYSPALFSSYTFPIFYKNKFVYANEDILVVYDVDTVGDSTPDTNQINFAFYPVYDNNGVSFILALGERNRLTLKIYDPSGREISNYQMILDRGGHKIPLWFQLSPGIYFARVEIKKFAKSVKFFVANRR